MQRLKDDEDLDKAIEVLNSPEKYKEILSVPVKVAEKQKQETVRQKMNHQIKLQEKMESLI